MSSDVLVYMLLRPPRYTRTHTLSPYATLFLSAWAWCCGWSIAASPTWSRLVWRRSAANVRWHSAPASRSIRPRKIRSEEHTSELQSLMRSSYAVFCLEKKKRMRPVSYNHHLTHERSHERDSINLVY